MRANLHATTTATVASSHRVFERRALPTLCLAGLLAIGCGGQPYEIAEVDGVLTLNGEPGHKVIIQFLPDPDAGVVGPPSVGETDDQGRFTLLLRERGVSERRPGAVVGAHRVVLTDRQLSASRDGRGVPIRFGPDYGAVGSTPLKQEIQPGKQTLEITIP